MERVFYTVHAPAGGPRRQAPGTMPASSASEGWGGVWMRSSWTWIGLLLGSAVVAAGCGPELQMADSPSTAPVTSFSPTPTASAPCGHADMAVDRGPYVIAGIQVPGFFPNMGPAGWQKDDLALRQVVILGKVVAEEAAAFGGEAHVYTPFAIEVERVIHGKAVPGPTRVSVEGGTVGCYEVHVDTVPALRVGGRYVLFLVGPAGTDPPPELWDVWMVDDQDVVWTYQGPMPMADLIDRIDRLSAAQASATP